ncbi:MULTISPECIES: hypothetical protein [unclassified Nitrobacter]|uniref:hypothetical protein n=1 Tax=unclassified Nitrobacter TaxID=2620411 RepID=UPI0003219368|nr:MULTISPECIES: hypothetical protein [unclassified Nitrobacter]MCB1392403.1 hypothetical protein [Nitrobacter sp.]MCV0387702.1 hypothetical protein [Nitrobacter sp.]
MLGEEVEYNARLLWFKPELGFRASSELADARPTRIGSYERSVTRKAHCIVAGTQDRPFYQLSADRVADLTATIRRRRDIAATRELYGFFDSIEVRFRRRVPRRISCIGR